MYLPKRPPPRAGWDKFFLKKQNTAGLNSEFSFSYIGRQTMAKGFSLPYYLSIAGERTDKFISFPRALALSEMRTDSSRIWTRVADYLYYDDNCYTMYVSISNIV